MHDENFDESGYVFVKERISKFRNEYPEGVIHSARTVDADGGVSFKTVVCRTAKEAELFSVTGLAVATGFSYLPPKPDAIDEKCEEKTETVSIGRALGNLGFVISKAIASADEIQRYKGLRQTEPEEDEQSNSGGPIPASKLKTNRKFNRTARFGTKD